MDPHNKTHPLVIAAAVAVLASSALAAAVLGGVLPSAASKARESSAFVNPVRVVNSALIASQGLGLESSCAACGVVESIRAIEVSTAYRVTVRMDDGSYRTVSQPGLPAQSVGEHVRVVNGTTIERV